MKLSNPFNCCRSNAHLQVVIPQQTRQRARTASDDLLTAIKNNDESGAKAAFKARASLDYVNAEGECITTLCQQNRAMVPLVIQFKMLRYECDRAIVNSISIESI